MIKNVNNNDVNKKQNNKKKKKANGKDSSSYTQLKNNFGDLQIAYKKVKDKNSVKKSNPSVGGAQNPILKGFVHPHTGLRNQLSIPSMPPLNTQKFTCHQSFEIGIGTAGFGFLGIRPTFAKDRDSFVHSLSTFTGTAASGGIGNGAVTGVTGAAVASFPYDTATMISSTGAPAYDSYYRPRLVCMGVSITYSGKAVDRGGTIHHLVSIAGEDVSGRSLQQVIASTQSVKCSVNLMSEAYMVVHGTLRRHYDLQNPEVTELACLPSKDASDFPYYDYTSGQAGKAPPTLGLALFTATPGVTFNVDVIAHYEVGGDGPGCLTTVCFSDEPALSRANNVSKLAQVLAKEDPHLSRAIIAARALSNKMGKGSNMNVSVSGRGIL